ncbi:MAG: SDR family NAD(P)-dependent oxidoreductase [Actinomycetales bacterium]|jgi:hypothetical protein
MTETALITGATAGIGAEFAEQLAASAYALVLVARDTGRLETKAIRLRREFGIDVETLTADLLTEEGVAAVSARLRQRTNAVTLLVNNAGHSLVKPFEANTVREEKDHLRILVEVPMELSHAALEQMLAAGKGRIINVASTAGFIPRGSYGAAKAWLVSFSRWANLHYRSKGVTVTALCPGFVHTEFHQRMGASTSKVRGWMWLNADQVVREGLVDSMAGKAISVPSGRYKVLIALSRLAPASWAAFAGRRGR